MLKFTASKTVLIKSYFDWVDCLEFDFNQSEHYYRGLVYLNLKIKKGFEENPDYTHPCATGKRWLEKTSVDFQQKPPSANFIKETLEKMYDDAKFSTDIFEMGILMTDGIRVYLGAVGGAGLCLLRNNSLVKILDSKKDAIFAEGKYCQSDILLITSNNFFNYFPEKIIKQYLSKYCIEKTALELEFAARKKIQKTISAIFVNFDGDKNNIGLLDKTQKINFSSLNVLKRITSIRTVPSYFKEKLLSTIKNPPNKDSIDRSKKYFLTGIILMVILVSFVFYGNKIKEKNDYDSKYASQINESKHLIDESLKIYSFDKEKSRELFIEGKNKAEDISQQGYFSEELDEIVALIKTNEGQILGEYKKDTVLFSDTSLLFEGFFPKKITLSNGIAFVSDFENNMVAKIEIDSKKIEAVAGPSTLDSLFESASYSERLFLFTEEGLFELVGRDLRKAGDFSDNNLLTVGYAGNLYLLKKDEDTIYRLSLVNDGDFPSAKWLSDGQNIKGSDVIDFAVDGAIWIVYLDGQIEKYISGNKQTFSLENEYENLKIDAIFSDDGTDGIYVLGKKDSRILKFNRDGGYEAQFINEKLKSADDFVIFENKAIILIDGKLFEMEV